MTLACSSAVLSACGDDDDTGNADGGAGSGGSGAASGTGGSAGSGGTNASAGGTTNAGGSKSTGGSAGSNASGAGGSAGDNAGGTDSDGGAGGARTEGCIGGLEGTWKIPGYEAYLRVDGACHVTMFCDLVKDYHSTGYFEGDTITLIDVATADVTLEGDTLTLLIPSETTDSIVFERQASEEVIPEACLE